MKRVIVGMSGGIDSTVAAYLLKKSGYDTIGVTMLTWKKDSPYPYDETKNSCYNPNKEEDIKEIKRLCSVIGIEHKTVDCTSLFESKVLKNFREEYMAGRTPNPCLWCNTYIKFGALLDEVRKTLDFDYFATGHYARIKLVNGRYNLLKAVDLKKDQSYFLSRLSQKQLSETLFPLGEMTKDEVRKIDLELGFHHEGQSESQDFYGGDYVNLLSQEDRMGDVILLPENRKIGEHRGFWHFTIGQRKGLDISFSEPLYVLSLESEKNIVYVGRESETKHSILTAENVNWVSDTDFDANKIYSAKIRSMNKGVEVKAKKEENGFSLSFLCPMKSITPGQSAVVYDGDRVIASGIINTSTL